MFTMSISYESPIAIPSSVAWSIQTLLKKMKRFTLTDENFFEFVAMNEEFKLINFDGHTATADELIPLIGFTWN
jgi:hypothetical protein